MRFKIYGLIDPRTNELKYIGQTSRVLYGRFIEHLKYDNKVSKKSFWIKKLKSLFLCPEIVLINTVNTIEESNTEEVFWISYFKFIGCHLLNAGIGGLSNAGCKRTEETKKNQSIRTKGIVRKPAGWKQTDEAKRKLSLARMGNIPWNKGTKGLYKRSEDAKRKTSEALKGIKNPFFGKRHTEETRKIMSEKSSLPERIKISLKNIQVINGNPELQKKNSRFRGKSHNQETRNRISASVIKTKKHENHT